MQNIQYLANEMLLLIVQLVYRLT